MKRRLPAALILTLGFLLVVVLLLVVGGLSVRSILRSSFADAEHIRGARILVGDALRAQLDEETGVRGYNSVHDLLLLEPFYEGRGMLAPALSRVRTVMQDLGLSKALPMVSDATATNRKWVRDIAYPLLTSHRHNHVLELRGKVLVDRFRDDLNAIDRALAQQELARDAQAQRAIGWADFFAFAAVVAVILAAAVFTVQQYRLGLRLEAQRAESERQRRQSVIMRAAFETEKRIADTLQEAFAQRVLPALPNVRLSATYVPATEEAKIGGDWYDAVQLSDDRILIAIGDVAGHGIEAAVAMNDARQLFTECALIDPTPGSVLERVNAALVAAKSPMITAVAGLVDARNCRFAYAAAGHPAPVLVEPGRGARFLDVGSLPLGVNAGTAYETHRVQSVAGAMLVLYTDGLIEHSRDAVSGETLLLQAVDSAAERPDADSAMAIREGIFDHHRVADDVAILTIRFVGAAAAVSGSNALRRTA